MKQPFALDRHRGQIMGVCAGTSEATGIDVTVLRVAAVLSLFLLGPVSLFIYLIVGWIAPER